MIPLFANDSLRLQTSSVGAISYHVSSSILNGGRPNAFNEVGVITTATTTTIAVSPLRQKDIEAINIWNEGGTTVSLVLLFNTTVLFRAILAPAEGLVFSDGNFEIYKDTGRKDLGSGGSSSVAWVDVTGKPTEFTPAAHNQAWSTITSTPTTLAGYGITDRMRGGSATLAYGVAPGTNVVETIVTGQTDIGTGARVRAWIQGDSTASYNAYEHSRILASRIALSVTDIIAGVGFTICASTELRLTGNIACRWEWS